MLFTNSTGTGCTQSNISRAKVLVRIVLLFYCCMMSGNIILTSFFYHC